MEIFPNFIETHLEKVHIFKTNTAATVCDKFFSQKFLIAKPLSKIFFLANMAHVYPDERSANNSIRIAAEACKVMGMNSDFVPSNSSLAGQIGF